MKLATIHVHGEEMAAIISGDKAVSIQTINEIENKSWSTNLFQILQHDQLAEINLWYREEGEEKLRHFPHLADEEIQYAPLYRNPRKILGVGMNL